MVSDIRANGIKRVAKRTLFGLLTIALLSPVSAFSATTASYDSVSIGYIPSRHASFTGTPHTLLEAKSLSHHKNEAIHRFHDQLAKLASQGIKGNATQMHEPTRYIETVYQGQRIRLFYSGDTGLARFQEYEQQWKVLWLAIYQFLSRDISPREQLNLDAKDDDKQKR